MDENQLCTVQLTYQGKVLTITLKVLDVQCTGHRKEISQYKIDENHHVDILKWRYFEADLKKERHET